MNNPFIKEFPIQLGKPLDMKGTETLSSWRAKVEEKYLQHYKNQLVSTKINISIHDDIDLMERTAKYNPVKISDDELQVMFSGIHSRKPITDRNIKPIYTSTNKHYKVSDYNDFKMKIKKYE